MSCNKKSAKSQQLRIQNILKMKTNKQENESFSTSESSPRKRQLNNSSNSYLESPSKKFRNSPSHVAKFKETLSSTPQRNKHRPSFENLCNKNNIEPNKSKNDSLVSSTSSLEDEKIEKNLSKSWIDIMEDLEEQGKELKEYIEKVKLKYKKSEEDLMTNIEMNAELLKKRQKQINYGKITAEYKRYVSEIQRKKRESYHPRTPNKFRKCSRRKFDGLIKKWRKLLHVWDLNPENLKALEDEIDDDDVDDADDCGDFNVDDCSDDMNFVQFNESFTSLNSNDIVNTEGSTSYTKDKEN